MLLKKKKYIDWKPRSYASTVSSILAFQGLPGIYIVVYQINYVNKLAFSYSIIGLNIKLRATAKEYRSLKECKQASFNEFRERISELIEHSYGN